MASTGCFETLHRGSGALPPRAPVSGGGGGNGNVTLQQLRDKISQLVLGHTTPDQKHAYLQNHFTKWSANRPRIGRHQFTAALQSMGLPLGGADEVFSLLDRDNSGTIDITEFCEGMVAPINVTGGTGRLPSVPATPAGSTSGAAPPFREKAGGSRSGSAMRSAGNVLVGGGSGQVDGYGTGSRGATPMGAAAAPVPPARNARVTSAASVGSARSGRSGSARGAPASLAGSARGEPRGANGPRGPSPRLVGRSGDQGVTVNLSDALVSQFRAIVLQRGGAGGIHTLGRSFRLMDDDGSRTVNLEELSTGLRDCGLRLGAKDLQLLLAAIDKDDTGSLSFDEFISAVRGEVNPRRQALINMAFDTFDRTGDGRITMDDICASYDASHHPDVLSGAMPTNDGLSHFLSQFDSINKDGTVTRKEFLEYYKNVSASIDDDDYFELMLRNAWHLSGGVGPCENTSNRRLLVSFPDGTQQVVALQNDLGLDLRDADAVQAHLEAQGVVGAVGYSMGQ